MKKETKTAELTTTKVFVVVVIVNVILLIAAYLTDTLS